MKPENMKTENYVEFNLQAQLDSLMATRKVLRESIHICYAEGADLKFVDKLDETLVAIDELMAELKKTINNLS